CPVAFAVEAERRLEWEAALALGQRDAALEVRAPERLDDASVVPLEAMQDVTVGGVGVDGFAVVSFAPPGVVRVDEFREGRLIVDRDRLDGCCCGRAQLLAVRAHAGPPTGSVAGLVG